MWWTTRSPNWNSPAELINIPEINDYLKDGDPDNDSPPDSE